VVVTPIVVVGSGAACVRVDPPPASAEEQAVKASARSAATVGMVADRISFLITTFF